MSDGTGVTTTSTTTNTTNTNTTTSTTPTTTTSHTTSNTTSTTTTTTNQIGRGDDKTVITTITTVDGNPHTETETELLSPTTAAHVGIADPAPTTGGRAVVTPPRFAQGQQKYDAERRETYARMQKAAGRDDAKEEEGAGGPLRPGPRRS